MDHICRINSNISVSETFKLFKWCGEHFGQPQPNEFLPYILKQQLVTYSDRKIIWTVEYQHGKDKHYRFLFREVKNAVLLKLTHGSI